MYNRSFSAPPVEKFILDDDIELDEIQNALEYKNYYKKNKNPRLDPPKFLFSGQSSIWASEHSDLIIKTFREKKTTVEMIDIDHPESKSCSEFNGKSRTTSPIGDTSYILLNLVQRSTPAVIIPITCYNQKSEKTQILGIIKDFYVEHELGTSTDISEICNEVCKDQEGSRFIQGFMDSWNADQISLFFDKIVNTSLELSTNLFGNYVIQKIIPFLREDQIFSLILQFFGHIYELSLHVYGCRVVQKLIDSLIDIKSVVVELEPHIAELIESPNGNHVIQKCIDKDIDKGFLLKEFEKNCIELSQQRYGCRVLQRLFEICTEEETWNIYVQIVSNVNVLINDKYGNYVVQHLIETPNKHRNRIFDFIIENAYELSKDKFSSNVVEKCVNKCTEEELEKLFKKVSVIYKNDKPYLYYMCIDMYANYVVQRFFDVSSEDLKGKAKALLRPCIKDMKSIPFTKHILTRLL
jgi:pumilio RNA-binding family